MTNSVRLAEGVKQNGLNRETTFASEGSNTLFFGFSGCDWLD
ncbi:hypothetical protein M2480_000972 [Parabacteroides sp. PFB2-12]|nr:MULTISPECIES: hypothetical protein [unclassified Parabacteroides]MDH6341571.1 hypothetical protein [Parabacteroides sp. PM6-13]MDH6390006.1 hypothetical protein [Parabacteroides sp. PFB2-12]